MLVLSRKTQESVVVGGSVGFERMLKVTVLEIDGGKVRLGFEVDKEVPVHHWEVWQRIHPSDGRDSQAKSWQRQMHEGRDEAPSDDNGE